MRRTSLVVSLLLLGAAPADARLLPPDRAAALPTLHLTMTKSASPTRGTVPLTVTYTFTLLNDSTTGSPLTSATVADGNCAPLVATNADGLLSAGEMWTYTCTQIFSAAGIYRVPA